MIRKAILIEASNIPGQTKLPGAAEDPLVYQRFLRSANGGEWYSHEIEIVSNPTISKVKSAIASASSADYAFIAFSGHGEHLLGKTVDETQICVNGGQMSAYELNPGNPRCTIVIDACRQIRLAERMERSLKAEAVQFSLTRPKKGHRELFDSAVTQCEKGPVYLYSCDKDESAGETSEGGFYSLFLVAGSEDWSESQQGWQNQILRIDAAHSIASGLTTKRQPQQHPQIQAGRRQGYFPFAIYIG